MVSNKTRGSVARRRRAACITAQIVFLGGDAYDVRRTTDNTEGDMGLRARDHSEPYTRVGVSKSEGCEYEMKRYVLTKM